MDSRQSLAVFGSTGSIGTSTLDVAARNKDHYNVVALTANRDVEKIFQQCLQFTPAMAAMADANAANELAQRLKQAGSATVVVTGPDALSTIASSKEVSMVMAAIVGVAGLKPTFAAANSGKRILLANKESLVVGGNLLVDAAKNGGATIIPVDSEHNAIFQCLPESCQNDMFANKPDSILSIVLTASGGPFRQTSLEQMQSVTVDQALDHPNWNMGPKVTVDSSTLMNKGLEVIEASYLFGMDEAQIEVVVHPQSTIHSMVRYNDGSVVAQMGRPDMRTPIAHAMAWPQRIDAGVEPLDFMQIGELNFEAPDVERFPCLTLARQALRRGYGATGVLNAANEVAVQAFLDRKLGFLDISRVNAHVLQHCQPARPETVEDLINLDLLSRQFALDYIDNMAN